MLQFYIYQKTDYKSRQDRVYAKQVDAHKILQYEIIILLTSSPAE